MLVVVTGPNREGKFALTALAFGCELLHAHTMRASAYPQRSTELIFRERAVVERYEKLLAAHAGVHREFQRCKCGDALGRFSVAYIDISHRGGAG